MGLECYDWVNFCRWCEVRAKVHVFISGYTVLIVAKEILLNSLGVCEGAPFWALFWSLGLYAHPYTNTTPPSPRSLVLLWKQTVRVLQLCSFFISVMNVIIAMNAILSLFISESASKFLKTKPVWEFDWDWIKYVNHFEKK